MSTLVDELETAWEYVSSIEPAREKVSREELRRVEGAIAEVERYVHELDDLPADEAESTQSALAVLYARGAAIAIAAGDDVVAQRWFDEGEGYAVDEAYAAQFVDGRRDPERFRKLVQGRQLIAAGRERAARALWREVVKANATDALAAAATAEQKAPRPLKNGQTPTLWTYNGIGVGFAGRRDRWDDGSYCTTHCIKLIYIPVWPLGAYRVADGEEDNQYYILAREPLSRFARIARYVVAALIVFNIGAYFVRDYLNDPERLANQRWDESMEKVAKASPQDALRELDDRMKDYDLWRIDRGRVEEAGAQVVKLAVGLVKEPFTAAALDQAGRVVRRYHALPDAARGGAAREAMLAVLAKWTAALGDGIETAEARLELLRHAETVADEAAKGPIAANIERVRLAAADAKAEAAPLEALAIYMEKPTTDALARASKVVARLAETPALLVDAGHDLEIWRGAVAGDDPLRAAVDEKLDAATVAKATALAEKVTPKQLAALLKQQPWNQWAVIALANADVEAGKLEAAANRLRAIGKPAVMVRDARQLLGQLASALGQLEEADALLTGLLGARLARFSKIATELEERATSVQDKLMTRLRNGDVPYDLQLKLQRASDDEQRELISSWMREQIEADTRLAALRETYIALGDVVPASLAAGTVKLRRAQAMAGAARDAMLAEAERLFLAIRTEAEGQPEFAIGLGEVYARLGKTTESEEQFATVLAMNRPELGLQVARVYRGIGSTERAKEVAKDVFARATSPVKDSAAVLLGIMYDTRGEEAEAEAWFRKADPKDPMVKTSLLELEARRLLRSGDYAGCAAKYAQVAKQHLASATAMDIAGFNNAALAYQNKFTCSGDPAALAEAEATLEKAYRLRGDEPIVVGNLAELHETNGRRRVLAKRVDMRALHDTAIDTVLDVLLAGSERDAVLADLDADRGLRRSAELLAQYEVLAPNSARAYEKLAALAAEHRDEAALAGVLERVQRAKGLDTSEVARTRERFVAGELDAQIREHATGALARLDAVLAKGKLDPRTRAAALVAAGTLRTRTALYAKDAGELATGRRQLQQAAQLWPALAAPGYIMAALIDEAGVTADAEAWVAARRERSAVAALAKLAADRAPLADKIRTSQQWTEVRAVAHTDTTRPGLDDLRIARLLGDPAIDARTKVVLDDKLTRLSYQIALVLDPTSPTAKADLADLDQR